jgi:hypothetical protein
MKSRNINFYRRAHRDRRVKKDSGLRIQVPDLCFLLCLLCVLCGLAAERARERTFSFDPVTG